MKLGLIAALAGIAVAVGLTKSKNNEALPATGGKRPKAPPPARKGGPITGTAPQEGVNMKKPPASPEKANGGARVTAP